MLSRRKVKLTINLLILSFVFAFTNCVKQEIDPLEKQIKEIDNTPISQSFYIIDVDSTKNVIDTLALRKLKYDENQKLIFENNIQLKHNLEALNYYNAKNEMIYSVTKRNGEIFSEFRVNLENNNIASAIYNVYEGAEKDSVLMMYQYTFDKEKKTKLIIDSGDDFYTIELYDEMEKPISTYSMAKNDTIEKTTYKYDGENKLKEKRIKNFSQNEEIVYEYDDDFIFRESFFSNEIERFRVKYEKDNQGNVLSYTKMIKDNVRD